MSDPFPDHRKTFESFVVNTSNQFAVAVARSSADSLIREYRQLAVYGPTSSGKSHLLHAFANRARQVDPEIRPLLINVDDFPNMLSCSTESMAKSKVRLVCVENLDQIAQNSAAWDWLTESLRKLNQAGGHAVLTCNLHNFEQAVFFKWMKQFEQNIIADVSAYTYAEHREILLKTTLPSYMEIPADVMDMVITLSNRDIGKMGLFARKLNQEVRWSGKGLSLDLARDILQKVNGGLNP